jgi:hypothetical protein
MSSRIDEIKAARKQPERCPRCNALLLFNNRTRAGVCDNCWIEEVKAAQRRLAKKYGKG